jgi:L-aminopeptidase/D-esterase-like protein
LSDLGAAPDGGGGGAGGAGGITDVAGVRVGHWSDPVGMTGCTVVVLPAGTVASGEVRGGAPGTREWALLDPPRTVTAVNAVVLTGGSAFGLASCDGVVRWCEERGIGFPSPAGPVPIVVGMVIYDLGRGDPKARPGAGEGYAACVAAAAGPDAVLRGRVGAGTGATIGKWRGRGAATPAGIGSASTSRAGLVVAALMVANALGEPRGAAGEGPRVPSGGEGEATTIGVVVTNASIDKVGCRLVAESAHDGIARALDPAHTAADGDAVVAAATGSVPARTEVVRAMAAWVVEKAILDACAGR